MRYFDEQLVANSRLHAQWWKETTALRGHFHNREQDLEEVMSATLGLTNASSVLPRDAWLEVDNVTRRIMRLDEGTFMGDLMALAKPVNIGKMVHVSRVSGDISEEVKISMSGQVAVPVDKVTYDYRGAPVPIFQKGYGREWREWNTLQSENFDALADDQEATVSKMRKAMAKYVLNGDLSISIENYKGYGIKNHPLSKSINLGTGVGGASINLASSTTTPDQIDAFLTGPFGAMLDANGIVGGVNLYVSPEIGRNWDRTYSGSAGFKSGRIIDFLLTNRRINKVTVDPMLSGNEFFGFVPSQEYIRPLVGMAVTTTPVARLNPTDNYHFQVMGALGLDIRADFSGKSGVFYSVVVN